MDTEEFGETSNKKTCDDDTDRPLKKAKYLWQVKGKYHLKGNNMNVMNTNPNDIDKKDKFLSKKENLPNENNINEIKMHNNNNNWSKTKNENENVCNDRSCIEAILANSDKYMDFSLTDNKNIEKSISDEIPITLVKPNIKIDDYYLRKWQARQIAKGFLDNTINRVLEHWMVVPFDAADFVENCDNGGQVEDEGILMAIQSHGLHSGMQSPFPKSLTNCNTRNDWEAQVNCTCTSNSKTINDRMVTNNSLLMPFHQRDGNSVGIRDDNHQQNDAFHLKYYENLCVLKDTEPHRESTELNFNNSSLSRTRILQQDNNNDTSSNSNSNTYDSLKIDDTDFLDAAVAVAIQKKGLTSFNCVDCG